MDSTNTGEQGAWLISVLISNVYCSDTMLNLTLVSIDEKKEYNRIRCIHYEDNSYLSVPIDYYFSQGSIETPIDRA